MTNSIISNIIWIWISTIPHEFWLQIYIYWIYTHTYIEISNLFTYIYSQISWEWPINLLNNNTYQPINHLMIL